VRREDLMRSEETGWAELNALLHGLSAEQLTTMGYTAEGWSIKDMMWHIAAWSADAAIHFERMRAGTFDPAEVQDIQGLNDGWFEVSKRLELGTVKAEWHAARTMMVERFGEAEGLPAEADEWFEEAGGLHYAKHVEDLRNWVERLTSRG
jgi:hypothetical protein